MEKSLWSQAPGGVLVANSVDLEIVWTWTLPLAVGKNWTRQVRRYFHANPHKSRILFLLPTRASLRSAISIAQWSRFDHKHSIHVVSSFYRWLVIP